MKLFTGLSIRDCSEIRGFLQRCINRVALMPRVAQRVIYTTLTPNVRIAPCAARRSCGVFLAQLKWGDYYE